MRKRSVFIAALLTASMLAGCSSVNININTGAKDEVPAEEETATETSDTAEADDDMADFPQLTSEDFDMSRFDDNKNMYFDSHGNTWTLSDESAKKYPKLADAIAKVNETEKKYITDCLDENDSDAREFAKEQLDSGYDGTFSCTSDMGIACADPKRVSLISTRFEYYGGAHPSTVTIAYDIDVESGQFVPLSAIIRDKEGLNKLLKEKLIELYTDHDFFGLDESLDSLQMALPAFETEEASYNFAFNPNGLTFYFDPAELSPYVFSGEQVDLTYEELSGVLEENFKP